MYKIIVLIALTMAQYVNAQQQLVIATYQYADNNRINNLLPIAEHIKSNTGISTVVKSYPTVFELIEAIQQNQVDIAFINTFGYFLLDASSIKHPMKATMALTVHENAKDNYKTVLFTHNKNEIDSLDHITVDVAIRNKLYLVNPGSTSGNLVPRLTLSGKNLSPAEQYFKAVEYGQNHQLTVEKVSQDTNAIGAVGYTAYFQFINANKKNHQLKTIWISPEIPLGPMLINHRVDSVLNQKLIDIFSDLHTKNSKALEALKNGWSEAKQAEKFIVIDHDYYLPFKQQLGSAADISAILKKFAN